MENPTKQEWQILEVLWDKHPLFLSDIVEALSGKLQWKNPTYQTYLRRMCAKGLIAYNKVRGSYAYYPLVQREECVQNESAQMINMFRKDSTKLFLANMISNSELDKASVEELKNLIESLTDDFQDGE